MSAYPFKWYIQESRALLLNVIDIDFPKETRWAEVPLTEGYVNTYHNQES